MSFSISVQAPGFGFGIAISGGRDNPHFQSGETSIVISDVLKGGPAEGLLQENDRVTMVNAVSMDNVEHAYAVQQLRKSGKNAKITIRRKRKVHVPMSRLGERATMSEHDDEEEDEEDSYDEEIYETRSARSGPSAYSADRERERSGSRERSLSPRADRRSLNQPPRPAKVTLVKSRKNEGEHHKNMGLRLASHIFVKDISPESLAARDGNIQEGDFVLKINGTVTENLSLIDAKKLIERSKGKLKMVVQRDERATLLNIPDLDDSVPSANASDRDDISDIHSVASDHSNRSHDRHRSSRSRSPDRRSDPSDHSRHSPPQISNGSGSLTVCPPHPTWFLSPPSHPVSSLPSSPTLPRPSMKLVKFKKGESVGLRLAGGNDVGIFVAGVLEDSPAAKEGLEEGDQILRVNNVDFANIIREEAVLFLLDLPKGEEVTILAQKKKDVYRRIVESDVGDSFYIRTHFEYEKESPYGLSFNKGEVFRVVDTLYNGKLGSWLAIRIGKNHQEVERGIIPNKNRAEQLSSMQYTLPKTAGGDRADFWRFRGLRSSKRNLRKSREDLSAQPVQTKFPAYERVVLREAGFLRPVVVFGPIADVAREKISREEPDLFELAKSEPRDAGTDQRSSGIIRLHTIKQIIDRDKHAVLDITPNAVDRLNYAQWYPIVVFLNPDSKQGVKNMRTRLCSESRKSARKLYERALKLRKNNHHLFTTTINMNNMNDGWYGALKETVQQQQNQLVWVSEGKADGAPDDDLDIHDDRLSYLSAPGSEYSMYSTDSRHTSDYEDTDTEGGAYTDQELDETLNDEVGLPTEPAITRSSEPVREDPPVIQDPSSGGYSGYQHASVTPAPEPQNAPGSKPLDDVAHSSNHYDADEDEEYYRKQLSYFDRRSFDSKTMNPTPGINRFPPQTQLAYPYNRAESVEKVSPVEKRYEPLPQISPVSQYGPPSPAVPPNSLPKLTTNDVNSQPDNLLSASPKHDLSGLRPSTLQDLPSQPYLAQRSPVGVNGTDAPPKTPGTTPTPQSYNRYVPKPYTSSARPFERKFESPKFNHNLLPNDLLISSSNPKPSVVNNNSRTKPPLSPQALDHDSGLDTFTRTMDNRGPKYQQHNNLVNNAVPKAIPVSVLEDDEEDEGHTVVATARGIFNCNGGVLSSIETGVSIIIPQGAIPDSIEQEIYFKVCRDNSILPPLDKEKGETLLSPLVMCGPHGLQFLKPVELRLPHCASMTPDGWSFALKSSDSSSGDSKTWQNKSLPGDPNYLVGANCVSVLIDHF
uniref:Tight junction protein 1 n=1 Tax=Oncorhynchus kisutch TaxID=8019 RepID=A0A8C7MST6_ONCKI